MNPEIIFAYLGEIILKIYQSHFFSVVKFLLIIYVSVLLFDILVLLYFRNILADIKKTLRGMEFPLVPKSKVDKRWKAVLDKMKTEDLSKYKLAIIEADKIVDGLLLGMGIKGDNMTEKLEKVNPGQFEYLEEIREAHKIRNMIINNPKFELTKEKAKETIDVYEDFLKSIEFI